MDKGKEMLGAALSTRRWSYLTISSDQGDLKISVTSRKWTGKEKRLFSGVSRFNITLHDLEHSKPENVSGFLPIIETYVIRRRSKNILPQFAILIN